MKIGIFTNNYLPNPYGVSGSVESFRKEFEKIGHDVFIFAPKWKGYHDQNKNVFRYPALETNVKIKFPIAIPYSRKMDKILEGLDLDIIHSQHPNLLGSAAARWARKKNIPLVFTWHTLYNQYAHFVPFIPSKLAAGWTIRNARNYANKCDQIIVPTPSIGIIIKNWGVTIENILAIPTGVEENEFENPDRNAIRKKYGVKDNEILVTVLTRLTQEKNIGFLVDTMTQTLRHNETVKFMICGEGDLLDEIKNKFSKEKLENKTILTGHISNDRKKNYFAAGDIFVWASKSETQGMILTEAMYSALPIVAVRASGAKDIILDGETGYLVSENKEEFSKSVQKLIDNEKLRKEFGKRAKQMARENYTSAVCARKMLEVYEKIINDFSKVLP